MLAHHVSRRTMHLTALPIQEPDVGDAAEQQTTAQENREYLVRRLTALLRKDRLKNSALAFFLRLRRRVPDDLAPVPVVPELVFDLEKRMKSWPESGCLDPFDDIYSVRRGSILFSLDVDVHAVFFRSACGAIDSARADGKGGKCRNL